MGWEKKKDANLVVPLGDVVQDLRSNPGDRSRFMQIIRLPPGNMSYLLDHNRSVIYLP